MLINKRSQFGFSIVEMIIYLAILTLVLLVLINTVSSFSKSYEQLAALRAADRTGLTAMERMTRDIHSASTVETADSTLGTSPGVLTLGIGTTTIKFYTVDGELRVDEGGVYAGPLSVKNGKVTNLIFRRITTTETEAVKINMTVSGSVGTTTKTKNFQTTVILKNS